MKKLNKLEINSQQLIKNEELLAIRGGYDGCNGSGIHHMCSVYWCYGCQPEALSACIPEGTEDDCAYVKEQNPSVYGCNRCVQA